MVIRSDELVTSRAGGAGLVQDLTWPSMGSCAGSSSMVPLQVMSSTGFVPFDTAAVGVYLQRTSTSTDLAQASAVTFALPAAG